MELNISKTIPEQLSALAQIEIEELHEYKGTDLCDLCDATEATMRDTYGFSIGFNRYESPGRSQLESYFRGILLVPEREIIVGRFDKVIAGSIQLVKPSPSNETSAFAANVDNHFVAPWARGFGLAKALLVAAEDKAREDGFTVIKLSVRANREAAIKLYESCDYTRWGTLDKYEMYGGEIIAGHFYYKNL